MSNEKSLIVQNDLDRASALKILDLLDISQNSIKDYRFYIPAFLDFLQANGGGSRTSYLDYKRHLKKRNDLSIASKNHYLIVARVWLREMYKLGRIPVDITLNVKTFKEGDKHKRFGLTEDEVLKIKEYLKNLEPSANSSKVKAIFSLLILQGLREVEIQRLSVEDLDLSNQNAWILGKGRDERERIKLLPRTAQFLRAYIKANKIGSGALFVGKSGRNRNQRLTTRSLRRSADRVFQDLGIEKSGCHCCRHYFITRLVKKYGGNLLQVAKYSRHNSINTLQVYWDEINLEDDYQNLCRAMRGVL